MIQLKAAGEKKITPEMEIVADHESLSPEFIRKGVQEGKIVILQNKLRKTSLLKLGKNKNRKFKPVGIGKGLRTKVNANIGTSFDYGSLIEEKKKLGAAVRVGADVLMDLSTGKNLKEIRRMILKESPLPLGTVPIYQVARKTMEKGKDIKNMTAGDMFNVIEAQAKEGVDFMTLHCGVTRNVLDVLKKNKRIMGIVSRGGAFLANWILFNKRENPLYEKFDKILEIAQTYDVTLSLGDGLRPGCLADSLDFAQLEELSILGELAKRARRKNVQVIIEGPGHVPLNQIETSIMLEKSLCQETPFYVLGPLVTDIAPGYDHITSAIGGAMAASYGADFLCYVTPAEHLSLPSVKDVEEGVIASRIAAHAADIVKGVKNSLEWDIKMAKARRALDWDAQKKLCINPKRFKKKVRVENSLLKTRNKKEKPCTMCGEFCVLKLQ
ncbi:phosphomethylpyrimidine synthase ThiC [bacterium]|nr:phosphomethylpyrimidine synthase ThiC [bacterium]